MNERKDLLVRMEYLEKQLASAEEDAKTNAGASKAISDMVEAGFLRQNLDGTVTVAQEEEVAKNYDPMNMGNMDEN